MIAVAIGAVEFAITIVFELFPKMDPLVESLVDAVVLSCLAAWIIRNWLILPMLDNSDHVSREIIESMSEGLVVQDLSGKITNFNSAACEILDLTADELSGRTSVDPRWKSIREDGSDFPGTEHPAMVTLRTAQPQRDVMMGVRRKSGPVCWILINSQPVFTQDKLSGSLSTFVDTTETRNARLKSSELNDRLSLAVQALGLGVWDLNLKTGTLVWDEFMYELFQIRKEDFSGDYDAFEKTLLPEDAARVQSELNATFERRAEDFRSQFRVRTKTGEILHIAAAARCIYDSEGKISRLIGNNWDISEEVKNKELIAEQNAKLIESSKMASLGVLSAGVAHEINNPLQMIQMATDLLNKSSKDLDKIPERIKTIHRGIERINGIISGLRKYSRTSTGSAHQPTTIATVVREALQLTQAKSLRHHVEVTAQISTDASVLGNELEIGQVVINLVNNAIDAASELTEKWVKLELIEEGDQVKLRITDSGQGIPSEISDKLFDPFFTTKPVGSGTGIGLSISKGIVDSHRGSIRVVSEVANTCFEVCFPKMRDHAAS